MEWAPVPDEDVPIIEIIGNEWEENGSYFYYKKTLDGTYNARYDRKNPTAELVLKLDLDGPKTGNQYQGKRFVLSVEFEAIQSSNKASDDRWGWSPGDE